MTRYKDGTGELFGTRNGKRRRIEGQPRYSDLVSPDISGIEDYFSNRRGTFEIESKDAINSFLAGANNAIDPGDALRKHLDAYSSSVWVHRCVSIIAADLAAVPLVATFKNRDGSVVDMPDSEQQMAIDNSSERLEVTDYIEIATQHLNLAGTAPIVAMRPSGDLADPKGRIEWFRPLKPSRVRAIPGEEEFIKEFRYIVSGEETVIHPDNVAFLRFPDPNSDYWGESPITVLARSVNVEQKLGIYNELLLDRGGRPNGMYKAAPDSIEDRTRRRLQFELDRRITDLSQTGKSVILPEGVEPSPTDFAPKDMMWLELFLLVKNAILAIYGVPPIKVMDLKDASKLANAGEQRKEYREGTLFHIGRKFCRSMARVIQLTYGPQWNCRFKWEEAGENLGVLEQREQARADFAARLVTRDEARLSAGEYGPAEDAAEGAEYASPSPVGPEPAALSFVGTGRKARPFTPEHKRFAAALATAQRRLIEPQLSRAIREAFTEQKARVISALLELAPEQVGERTFVLSDGYATMKTMPFHEQELLDRLFDSRKEGDEFRKIVGPVFLRNMVSAGAAHLRTLFSADVVAALRTSTARYEQLFNTVIGAQIKAIQETTRKKISEALQQSFEQGTDPRQLGGTLSKLFDHWGVEPLAPGSKTVQQRADLIAQTEFTTLFNGSAHAANLSVADEGGVIVKGWDSTGDSFVRDEHQDLDRRYSNNPIPVTEAFIAADGSRLMYPGDPSGPVHQTARCRCTLVEQVLELPTI